MGGVANKARQTTRNMLKLAVGGPVWKWGALCQGFGSDVWQHWLSVIVGGYRRSQFPEII
jgi:hypothetical protein